MSIQKTCLACGTEFMGRRERRACSLECGNRLKLRPKPPRPCEHCSALFIPVLPGIRFCSKACSIGERNLGRASKIASRVRFPDCIVCGNAFCTRNSRANTCGTECKRRYLADWAKNKLAADPAHRERNLAATHARRADKLGLGNKTILLSYLVERDGGQCRIPNCLLANRKVGKVGSKGPNKPSVDHIIPLSKGGEHALHNVQLAHARCNYSKNNRGAGDQLALIG